MTHVRDLSEISLSDAESAGGKGANLGELIAAGFGVPAGFRSSGAGESRGRGFGFAKLGDHGPHVLLEGAATRDVADVEVGVDAQHHGLPVGGAVEVELHQPVGADAIAL